MRLTVANKPGRGETGFTLLELVIVVAVIAVLAGIGATAFTGINEQTSSSLVRSEMQQIAAAIGHFREDTGYWPGEGPFYTEIEVDKALLKSPANLDQLQTQPELSPGHFLQEWSVENGRGWHGPYLSGYRDGCVAISDSAVATDGSYSPLTGTNSICVPAIADPFENKPVTQGGKTFYIWKRNGQLVGGDDAKETRYGRPYLYLHRVNGTISERQLVSMGPDGKYGTEDDIKLILK